MKSSSVLPCWAHPRCLTEYHGVTVLEHPEGELGELGEQLDDGDDGHGLGLDALYRRAPAADLLLLVPPARTYDTTSPSGCGSRATRASSPASSKTYNVGRLEGGWTVMG